MTNICTAVCVCVSGCTLVFVKSKWTSANWQREYGNFAVGFRLGGPAVTVIRETLWQYLHGMAWVGRGVGVGVALRMTIGPSQHDL